mmetsp:Transcript_31629/g.71149  ORF Transcript_31629/g.71149 Transcript_31629/m.71149 type:complete len:263 (-) Transcript_31629:296-1084(-)
MSQGTTRFALTMPLRNSANFVFPLTMSKRIIHSVNMEMKHRSVRLATYLRHASIAVKGVNVKSVRSSLLRARRGGKKRKLLELVNTIVRRGFARSVVVQAYAYIRDRREDARSVEALEFVTMTGRGGFARIVGVQESAYTRGRRGGVRNVVDQGYVSIIEEEAYARSAVDRQFVNTIEKSDFARIAMEQESVLTIVRGDCAKNARAQRSVCMDGERDCAKIAGGEAFASTTRFVAVAKSALGWCWMRLIRRNGNAVGQSRTN